MSRWSMDNSGPVVPRRTIEPVAPIPTARCRRPSRVGRHFGSRLALEPAPYPTLWDGRRSGQHGDDPFVSGDGDRLAALASSVTNVLFFEEARGRSAVDG